MRSLALDKERDKQTMLFISLVKVSGNVLISIWHYFCLYSPNTPAPNAAINPIKAIKRW